MSDELPQILGALVVASLREPFLEGVLGFSSVGPQSARGFMYSSNNAVYRGDPARLINTIVEHAEISIDNESFEESLKILHDVGIVTAYRKDKYSHNVYIILRDAEKKLRSSTRIGADKYTVPYSLKYKTLAAHIDSNFYEIVDIISEKYQDFGEILSDGGETFEERDDRTDPLNSSLDDVLKIAPSADGYVRIDHNISKEFDDYISDVSYKFESINHTEDEFEFRQIISGKLKAGRELIRSGVFQIELIYLTLIEALKAIVIRYEREIIAGIAATLIAAVFKNLFGIG